VKDSSDNALDLGQLLLGLQALVLGHVLAQVQRLGELVRVGIDALALQCVDLLQTELTILLRSEKWRLQTHK
jgi:hypothetical protein